MASKPPKQRRAGTTAKAKRPARGKPAAKKPPAKAKPKARAKAKAKAKPQVGARPAARKPPPPPKARRGVLARLKRGVSAMAANAKGALGRMLGRAPSAESPPLEEALAEPLHDMSGEHRLAAELARARDVDEDDQKRFSDPSLVVEAEARRARGNPPGSSTLEVDDDDVVAIEPDPSRRR